AAPTSDQTPAGNGSSVQTPKSSAGQGTSSKPRRHSHKSKPAIAPCVVAPVSPAPAESASGTTSQNTPDKASDQAANPTAPKNCPPPKIVVRQGGTKDPSIQLAGGPGTEQTSQKREAIIQVLDVTDQNLKKTGAMQLTSAQQDTVTQTRQFMEQSKAAMADGDFERARTLAWKAQLLSEDLIKPEK